MNTNSTNPILQQGYSFISGETLLSRKNVKSDFCNLADAFEHCKPDGGNRRRYYGRYFIKPTLKGEELNLQYLSSDYWQSSALNPEAGGRLRSFASIPDKMLANKAMIELLKFDYSLVPFELIWNNFQRNPVEVGIHFIRMSATCDHPGISTPNSAHRDGEFFTFIHLIKREGVIGGDSLIYSSIRSNGELIRGPLLYTRTMDRPLDTIIVWDRNVFHDITPVVVPEGLSGSEGVRDVILIDFSPYEPVKVDSKGDPSIETASFDFNAA
jgi:hypothetical protein